jgi:hypothetical protein
MTYIDTRKEDWTTEELLALYSGEVKPYPQGWHDTAEEIIAHRNASVQSDWEDSHEAIAKRCCEAQIASGECDEDEIDWSEFSCPVEPWAYLYQLI